MSLRSKIDKVGTTWAGSTYILLAIYSLYVHVTKSFTYSTRFSPSPKTLAIAEAHLTRNIKINGLDGNRVLNNLTFCIDCI